MATGEGNEMIMVNKNGTMYLARISQSLFDMISSPDCGDVHRSSSSLMIDAKSGLNEYSEISMETSDPIARKISESPTSFLNYTDDDDDEEDDDDLLHTAPAFLKSLEEVANRPSPEPSVDHSFNLNSSTDSLCNSPATPQNTDNLKRAVKSRLCLDNLLQEQTEKAMHVKDYNDLRTELKTDGGFVNILNKEEETPVEEMELQEDQEQILRQFSEGDIGFPEDRPGFQVFDKDKYGYMFDKTLHPCDCGFTVSENGTATERHLLSITQDQYQTFVESDILCLCYTKIVCKNEVLRWLLFLMSVDDNFLMRQGCNKTLLNVIHQQRIKGGEIWCPSVYDFITVLCNFGASLDSLIPGELEKEFDSDIVRNKLLNQARIKTSTKQKHTAVSDESLRDKIKLVLQIIAISHMKNSCVHNPKELTLYVTVTCKIALDPLFKDLFGLSSLHNSIDMIMQSYSETDWEQERILLCRVLLNISSHHHDMTYICKLLPEGHRGMYVRQRLSYLMLSSLLKNVEVSDSELHDLKIKDLYQFIPAMSTLLFEDLYKLSSVITLLDNCVASNYNLTSTDREELKVLIDLVKKLRLKDNVAQMNRTKVKDILVRVTSSWALDIQTFKGKQTKIFEYISYQSPIKMKIEKIETHALDVSDDSLSGSESDDEIPCKLPKLSNS